MRFKYLECVLNESGTNETEYSRKAVSGRRVVGDIRSLVDAGNVQLECALVFLDSFLVPALAYGSETMIWREKERSRIRALQMDNPKGLLGPK